MVVPIEPSIADQTEERARPRRRVSRSFIAVMVVALLALGAVLVGRVQTDQYAISPGQSNNVLPMVHVAGYPEPAGSGGIYMADVFVTQLTWFGLLRAKFQDHTEIVSGAELGLSSNQSIADFSKVGYLDMAQSQQNATIAGLRAAHRPVEAAQAGAVIYALRTDTSSGLQVGDRVVAIGSTAIHNSCDLARATSAMASASTVTASLEPASIDGATGAVTYGAAHPVVLRASSAATPLGLETRCTGTPNPTDPFGIAAASTSTVARTPLRVSFNLTQVGGPSAGLAMTLGLLETLDGASLTAGRRIAATGTMDPAGDVGDVGGVAQKTIAVEQAGATVFFVPTVEVSTAEHAADGHLAVVGVRSLDQALAYLASTEPKSPVTTSTRS